MLDIGRPAGDIGPPPSADSSRTMPDIDVLLITALKEEHDAARDAALSHTGGPGVAAWEERDTDTATPYLLGTYVGSDGSRMLVALARPTRMGATSTAPIAAALAERLRPKCIAMCGVCAGNPADVSLGDVIIAEMAYTYDEGKRQEEGFEADYRPILLSDDWLRSAQDMLPDGLASYGEASPTEAERWLLERLLLGDDPVRHPARARYVPNAQWRGQIEALERDDFVRRNNEALVLTERGRNRAQADRFYNVGSPDVLPFAIRAGPMASGNAVVKDGVTWRSLQQHGVRTVLGLEMEAAAIGGVAHRLRIPYWVVAKGVMDYADPRKDDRYKPFAARASAEVLFAFLLKQVASAPHAAAPPHATAVRRAYVIGGVTEETDYRPFEELEFQQQCSRIGAAVAQSGAALVACSPFPDAADLHAVVGYVQAGVGGEVHFHSPRHTQVAEKRRELAAFLGETTTRMRDFDYPGPEAEDAWSQAWLLCQIQALETADVVIAIGGRISKTANTLLHLAEAWQIPIVPFAFLGGAARRAYDRVDWVHTHPSVDRHILVDKRRVGEAMSVAGQLVLDRVAVGDRAAAAGLPRQVFISRASTDAEFSDALAAFLTRAGVTPQLGDHAVRQERLVQPAIHDAILQSDVVVVLWSGAYARSPWCYDELEFALQRKRVGAVAVWLFNLDGSDVVLREARALPQAVVRTPTALVEAVRALVESATTPP